MRAVIDGWIGGLGGGRSAAATSCCVIHRLAAGFSAARTGVLRGCRGSVVVFLLRAESGRGEYKDRRCNK
jgi:hypothetical protein